MRKVRKHSYKILLLVLSFILLSMIGCSKNSDKEDIKSNDEKTQQTDNSNYEFTEHELNIIDDNYRTYYEIFVYSFYDSDGDRIGDLKGVIQKLDYIKDMGFNGIWLMPIMPSPSYHKYDVVDYYAIDPEYGTMEDFKELVSACKERGIKLILDLVLNHTSPKHEWFKTAEEYLSSLPKDQEPNETECPYIGYYNIVKGKPDSGAYYQIKDTDYYYEGVFSQQMPDLNLANKALRKDLEEVMSYWLNLGVGGFRLDAAKEYYTGSIDKNVEVLQWVNEIGRAHV